MNTRLIYKIVDQDQWKAAQATGAYPGSQDDMRDGFIHLSASHQLRATAEKHFIGKKNLLLVAFEEKAFGGSLKWEPSRGGDLFPHLYAVLPSAHALWTKKLELGEDGVPVMPAGFDQC